jgi:hypothetical protein
MFRNAVVSSAASFLQLRRMAAAATKRVGLTLHGSQQTRSPLVSWYLLENKIKHAMKPPRPSNHPFGQTPFLTGIVSSCQHLLIHLSNLPSNVTQTRKSILPDDGGVEVFESGAILLYLAQTYGPAREPKQLGADLSWVVWANSELDPLCFGKGMRYELDRPRQRSPKPPYFFHSAKNNSLRYALC